MNIRKEVFKLYSKANIKDKFHIIMRLYSCPFEKMEPYLPRDGEILDLGCSHGIFTNWCYLSSSRRKILGIDYSEEKIKIAKHNKINTENISFLVNNITTLNNKKKKYNGIVIADVLYLIPFDKQKEIINKSYDLLEKNGVLLIKEIGKKPFYKFFYNWIQETISVKIFKITKGESFFFRSGKEYKNILEEYGFKFKEVRIDKGYVHPHILYLGIKQG